MEGVRRLDMTYSLKNGRIERREPSILFHLFMVVVELEHADRIIGRQPAALPRCRDRPHSLHGLFTKRANGSCQELEYTHSIFSLLLVDSQRYDKGRSEKAFGK